MKLAQRVSPRVNESLAGFMMRAAEINHLPGCAVRQALLGRVSRPPEMVDAARLAKACGCSVPEIVQLFGFRVRREDGIRCWRLGSEWITKTNFVSSRFVAVCRDCLCAELYSPGAWELSLYRTCAFHRSRLISICNNCHRPLRWSRSSICACGCGYDLRHSESVAGSPASWVVAQLIECRLDPSFKLVVPSTIPNYLVERLAALSLDGLFKTIWFLGHCVAGFDACVVGHGQLKPKDTRADSTIEQAFTILARWPESLWEQLTVIGQRPLANSGASLYERMYGPISSYLKQELPDKEFLFIRLAYERHIRRLWRELGQRHPPRSLDYQMELNLEE